MKICRKHIPLTLLFLFSNFCYGQNFEWLRTFGNKGIDVNWDMSADAKGGLVFISSHAMGTVNDTIFFDSIALVNTSTNYGSFCSLVRLDSNGKVIRAKIVSGPINIPKMCRDTSGNYYIAGFIDGTKPTKIGTVSLSKSNGTMVFAKFDKDLNFIWAVQSGNDSTTGITNLISSNGHLYFICGSKDTTKIGGSTYISSNWYIIYGELNQSNGNIKWSKSLVKNNDDFRISSLIKLKDKLYLSGDFESTTSKGLSKVLIGNDTIFGPGGFVLQTDTIGNYIKKFNIYNGLHLEINCIESDGEFLYIGGCFLDSINWGKQKITSMFNSGGSLKKTQLYAASLTTDLQTRWFFRPKIITGEQFHRVKEIATSQGYVYFGAMFKGVISINNNILSANRADILLFKTDFLGNILWATSGGASQSGININTMDAIAGKSIFAGGDFIDTVKLGSLKSNTRGVQDCWVTKISDYSITRGKVSSGPYCAGDTIKIPYTKFGDFDTANVFIAQLSDEDGNFENGYRELGRLKSNKDGTILGKLPLFKVSTSANYRIRVLSTKPVVQSYYLRDTLRLLIYSKDKADPGHPETICYGDSLKLNTYGGTKWTWSPKYKMSDSTLRQPIVWPTQNTTYKIIIGDSSGCGAPDTAYKQIKVRYPLKTVLAFTDTAVCGNGDLKVPYYFTGGDSVNYKFQWYYVSSPKLWFATKKGQNVLTDTLVYYPSDPFEKLAIVLKDGCTNKPDTVYLTISQRKPVVISTKFSDTNVCNGQTLNYKATATSGLAKSYRYQWKDLNSNLVLSSSDSLKLSASKTLKIQLIVNDGCEALGDTALFEVKVKAELKAQSNLRDTAICYGKTLYYSATAQGGDAKAYKFSWVLNNKLIDSTSTLTLTSVLSSTLSLILKDNCSFPNDTIKKTITVKPSPKADFIWDLACSKTITKFQFTGSKPQSPIQTSFRWNFNNEDISSIENPSHKFASAGTSTSTLILSSDNGCSDTMKKDIVIKPQSKADFTANDVCETDSAVFINKSQDATSYNWRFGDGQKSTKESPKHLYTIGGTTTTFNVSLVAVVANGCSDSIGKAISINSNPNSGFTHTLTGTKVDLKATVQGNTKYQWKFGSTDSATTTSGNYTFNLTKPEQYKICLKVTNLAGCISQTCKDISVGISDILKPSGFKIYPNPNSGIFTIEIENPSNNSSIEVYNLLGELIKKIEKVGKVTTLNLDATAGIYFVMVKNGDAVWGQKVTITN